MTCTRVKSDEPPWVICTRSIVVQKDDVLALLREMPEGIDPDDLMY